MSNIVETAKKYLGTPYLWGGAKPEDGGFDCSGLIQYVYSQNGYSIPRTAQEQFNNSTQKIKEAMQPGDLVFVGKKASNGITHEVNHVLMYIGDNKAIESPRTGLNVRIVDLDNVSNIVAYGSYLNGRSELGQLVQDETKTKTEVTGAIADNIKEALNVDTILSNIVKFITITLLCVLAMLFFMNAFEINVF